MAKKELEAFKEKLKNLHVNPPDIVWENISAVLDKEEKEKIFLPLWIKVSSIAAIFLFFGYTYLNKNTKKQNYTITNKHKLDITSSREANIKNTLPNLNNEITLKNKSSKLNTITESQNTAQIKIPKKNSPTNKQTTDTEVNTLTDKKNSILNTITESQSIAQKQSIILQNKNIPYQHKLITKIILTPKKIKCENSLVFSFAKIITIRPKIDMPKEKKLRNKNKRWNVTIKGSPIYYSTLKRGSSLNIDFSNNQKKNELSSSYGVETNYHFNDKIKLRTGVHSLSLAYTTIDATKLSTLNSSSIALNQSILESFSNFEIATPIKESIFNLTQKIHYIEVPLEISINIINKRYKIDLISGFSGLFLTDNSILINNHTEIGKVTNLNKISYTGNLGIGFHYSITKNFSLSAEPTLKLQAANYNDNTNFTPYYFGIYSGIHYSF